MYGRNKMTAMVFMAQGGREFKSFFMGYRFSVLLLLGCKGKRGKTCLPQTRLPSSLFHRSIHPEMCVECSNAYDSTVVCSSMYISISRYVAAQSIPKLIQKKCVRTAQVSTLCHEEHISGFLYLRRATHFLTSLRSAESRLIQLYIY